MTQAQDAERGAVRFDANDRWCLDGQRLVVTSGAYGIKVSKYNTELESHTSVLQEGPTVDGDPNGAVSFAAKTKSGLTMLYGATDDSRLQAPGRTVNISWLLSSVVDRLGNTMTVSYTKDSVNGVAYPSRIDYLEQCHSTGGSQHGALRLPGSSRYANCFSCGRHLGPVHEAPGQGADGRSRGHAPRSRIQVGLRAERKHWPFEG